MTTEFVWALIAFGIFAAATVAKLSHSDSRGWNAGVGPVDVIWAASLLGLAVGLFATAIGEPGRDDLAREAGALWRAAREGANGFAMRDFEAWARPFFLANAAAIALAVCLWLLAKIVEMSTRRDRRSERDRPGGFPAGFVTLTCLVCVNVGLLAFGAESASALLGW